MKKLKGIAPTREEYKRLRKELSQPYIIMCHTQEMYQKYVFVKSEMDNAGRKVRATIHLREENA